MSMVEGSITTTGMGTSVSNSKARSTRYWSSTSVSATLKEGVTDWRCMKASCSRVWPPSSRTVAV